MIYSIIGYPCFINRKEYLHKKELNRSDANVQKFVEILSSRVFLDFYRQFTTNCPGFHRYFTT